MSQGIAIDAVLARRVAEGFVEQLRPACERIEIAGSLRRGKSAVHDIEIVAVPRFADTPTGDLWGTAVPVDLLEEAIAREFSISEADYLTEGRIDVFARPVEIHRSSGEIEIQTKLGPAFKALLVDGIPLDLFVVRPPAQWGVIFGLRTGPGAWNIKLVEDCKAISRRVREGQVETWVGATGRWEPVPTPEEADFFRAIGQAWVEPAHRQPAAIAIQRAIAVEIKEPV